MSQTPGRRARELRVVRGLEDAARGDERLRRGSTSGGEPLVDRPRIGRRAGVGNIRLAHVERRVVVRRRRIAAIGPAVVDEEVRTEPVLQEVVRQEQAPVVRGQVDRVAERWRTHGVVVERVGELEPGVTPRVEELAALVQEGPDLEHHRVGLRLGSRSSGLTRDPGEKVVRRVPDHRLVVAEDAQVIGRRAQRVHVVDVVGPPGSLDGFLVVGQERRLAVRRDVRREVRRTRVVRVRQDQHLAGFRLLDMERERRARLARSGEPHLDVAVRGRAGHGASHDVVVHVAGLAVAVPARPLGRRKATRRRGEHPVDRVVELHVVGGVDNAVVVEIPARQDLHGLIVPVERVGEREVAHRVERLLRVNRRRVQVEGLGRDLDRRRGVVGIGCRLGCGDGEVEVDHELVLHLALAVRELETVVLVPLAQLRRDGQGPVLRVGVVCLFTVGGVQVCSHPGVESLHGRLLVGPGPRDEDRIVGGRRVHLEAEGVQEQLAERVVADVVFGLCHLRGRCRVPAFRARRAARDRDRSGRRRSRPTPRRRSSSARRSSGCRPRHPGW